MSSSIFLCGSTELGNLKNVPPTDAIRVTFLKSIESFVGSCPPLTALLL